MKIIEILSEEEKNRSFPFITDMRKLHHSLQDFSGRTCSLGNMKQHVLFKAMFTPERMY